MVSWSDWYNIPAISLDFNRLLGVLAYGSILLLSIIFQYVVSNKVRNSKLKTSSFTSFRMLFIAITFITTSYFSDFIGSFLGGNILHSNFSVFLSVIGYTMTITALNIFMLNIINFRTRVRKIIKIFAYIEAILLGLVALLYLFASFSDIVPTDLLDYMLIILGLIVVAATVFTIITILVEAKSSANKMIKLRLRMSALGIFGILIDGLLNMVYFMLGSFDIEVTNFYHYGMPSIGFVVYLIAIMAFFYSLFPPLWLQQATGVLPPSFRDLMEKQDELKSTGRIVQ
ncbi:MAG: hypothetical protein ACTSSH_01350 [Candidatus Heimdallarchaeota archaeon]